MRPRKNIYISFFYLRYLINLKFCVLLKQTHTHAHTQTNIRTKHTQTSIHTENAQAGPSFNQIHTNMVSLSLTAIRTKALR